MQSLRSKVQGAKSNWRLANGKVLFAVFFLLFAFSYAFGQQSSKGKPRFVPGQVLIKYKPDVSVADINAKFGTHPVVRNERLDLVRCHTSNMDSLLAACKADPDVVYAEPLYLYYAQEMRDTPSQIDMPLLMATPQTPVVPNDPRFSSLYGMQNSNDNDIDAPEAWGKQTGSASILVAVIDTGVDYNHEDLQSNMWRNPGESGGGKENNGIDDDGNGYKDDYRGWNFVSNNNDPYDDNQHGTHCSGTIGGIGNNGKGVVGVNWTVKIMPLKFLSREGSGTSEDAADAILYAANMGAMISSNSWGGGEKSQAIEDAIRDANTKNHLFVAAAGNESSNNDATGSYPANYDLPNVISVAANDRNDNLASFSNYGRTKVHLSAPGVDILSCRPNNLYQLLSGTSMATPHVAGAAALIAAHFPGITHTQIRTRILGAVDRKSQFSDRVATGGRLNVNNALTTSPLVGGTTVLGNTPNTTGPYVVSTNIVDDTPGVSGVLHWVINNATSDSVVMSAQGNDAFRGQIPGQALNTTISYYITARDAGGNLARDRTYTFRITTETGQPGGACCGNAAVSMGWNGKRNKSVEVPVNLAILALPVVVYVVWRKRSR